MNISLGFKVTPIFVFNGMISFSFHFPQYLINPILGAVLNEDDSVSFLFNYVNINLIMNIIYELNNYIYNVNSFKIIS